MITCKCATSWHQVSGGRSPSGGGSFPFNAPPDVVHCSFGASPLPSSWDQQQAAAATLHEQQHHHHHQHQKGAAVGGGASEGSACGNRRSFPLGIGLMDEGFGLDLDLDMDVAVGGGATPTCTGMWLDRHPGIATSCSEGWNL